MTTLVATPPTVNDFPVGSRVEFIEDVHGWLGDRGTVVDHRNGLVAVEHDAGTTIAQNSAGRGRTYIAHHSPIQLRLTDAPAPYEPAVGDRVIFRFTNEAYSRDWHDMGEARGEVRLVSGEYIYIRFDQGSPFPASSFTSGVGGCFVRARVEVRPEDPNAPQPMRAVRCQHCGEATGEFSSGNTTTTCENCTDVPRERNMAHDGARLNTDAATVDDERPNYQPVCVCGAQNWTAHVTADVTEWRAANAWSDDEGREMLWVDPYDYETIDSDTQDYTIERIECRSCGRRYEGEWDYS